MKLILLPLMLLAMSFAAITLDFNTYDAYTYNNIIKLHINGTAAGSIPPFSLTCQVLDSKPGIVNDISREPKYEWYYTVTNNSGTNLVISTDAIITNLYEGENQLNMTCVTSEMDTLVKTLYVYNIPIAMLLYSMTAILVLLLALFMEIIPSARIVMAVIAQALYYIHVPLGTFGEPIGLLVNGLTIILILVAFTEITSKRSYMSGRVVRGKDGRD